MRLTTQAQRPGARDATIATATLTPGWMQRMVMRLTHQSSCVFRVNPQYRQSHRMVKTGYHRQMKKEGQRRSAPDAQPPLGAPHNEHHHELQDISWRSVLHCVR